MVDMTLIRPLNEGQGHSFWFGTNRFPIGLYDFLQALNSNFCSRTHRLATIHSVQSTDVRFIIYRQTDDDDDDNRRVDRRNTVPIARLLVRSAVEWSTNE